jgi:hypothetical protein
MQPPFDESSSFSWIDPAPRFDPAGTEDPPDVALKQAIADLEQMRQVHSATLVKLAEAQRSPESQTKSDREQQLEAEIELLRSKVIKEMSYVQENYWQQIVRLTDELQRLNHLRAHLERELDYRSTSKAAVRQIIKTALRKLKLFGFIYRRYEAFVPVYNLLFGDRWKPATIAAAQAAAAAAQAKAPPPPINIDSDRVNALVLARSMGIEVRSEADLERLDHLATLTQTTTRALCIAPIEPHLPLLCALVKQGATVQCVGCSPSEQHDVWQYEMDTTTQSLTEWMMTTPDVCLADYQVICLDATSRASHTAEGDVTEVFSLLRGHLSPDVQLIFSRSTA